MWIILLILAIVIILYLLGRNAPDISEQYEGLLNEVVEKLKVVQKFTNSPRWDTASGLTMLIPINANGEMYRPDSDKIEISILLYEDIETIQFNTQFYTPTKDFLEQFRLVQTGNSLQYKSTTVHTFNCGYKTIMATINKRITTEFPNVRFEFNGSNISTKKMIK